MSAYTSGLICQTPKTATIYIERHGNGGIRRVPYIVYFSKKLVDVKEPSLSHIQNCAIFLQMDWYEFLYMCSNMPDAENRNNLYLKAWKWRYTEGTIYWLFFKEIARCRRAKPVTYSKLCNIFPEWIDMSTYTCWPSMPDAENPNNLYFKAWNWGYTQGTTYWLF